MRRYGMDNARELIAVIAKRVKMDLSLIEALAAEKSQPVHCRPRRIRKDGPRNKGLHRDPSYRARKGERGLIRLRAGDTRFRLYLKVLIAATRSIFIDPSLLRIDCSRYLKEVTSLAGEVTGRTLSWEGPSCRAWADMDQAAYAGLALSDIIWDYRPRMIRFSIRDDKKMELCCISRKIKAVNAVYIIKRAAALKAKLAFSATKLSLIFPAQSLARDGLYKRHPVLFE